MKKTKRFTSTRMQSGTLHITTSLFYTFYKALQEVKGRSRISMVWVPPLGFDPYCEGKWLPLQDEFTPSINTKRNFLQKL